VTKSIGEMNQTQIMTCLPQPNVFAQSILSPINAFAIELSDELCYDVVMVVSIENNSQCHGYE